MKQFIFLYPIPEYINHAIENYGRFEEGGIEAYRQRSMHILNQCIEVRYRQQGFGITYAIFDGHTISDVIELQPLDRIIEVGMEYRTHTTPQPEGSYRYPDPDYILDQMGEMKLIRISGFHMWDCVEKLARRAYERGLDTLVDEDLTEFFTHCLTDENFRVDTYPTYNPREGDDSASERWLNHFLDARKDKPWLW